MALSFCLILLIMLIIRSSVVLVGQFSTCRRACSDFMDMLRRLISCRIVIIIIIIIINGVLAAAGGLSAAGPTYFLPVKSFTPTP